jgi:hypothetical protein
MYLTSKCTQKRLQYSLGVLERFFVAQDRQANGCLHTDSFAGRKDMEHEVRNGCVLIESDKGTVVKAGNVI